MSKALEDVAKERRRQLLEEGFTPRHDDQHDAHELTRAAISYIRHVQKYAGNKLYGDITAPSTWPWGLNWWKPRTPRRDLIRAAALLVAEIERLDRIGE
jgi:hypothetical protein